MMGCSAATILHYERGDRSVPGGWYERAAEVLGVPLERIAPEDLIAA